MECGSHEAVVYNSVPVEGGIDQSEIMKNVPNAKVGFSKAMALGWIMCDKSSGKPVVKRKVESVKDTVKENLNHISETGNIDEDSIKQDYKKRKLIVEVVVKSLLLKKGPDFTVSISKPETDLTHDLLVDEGWRDKKFKDYNFDAMGVPPEMGCLHPLMKVRAEFRKIFLEMGFQEVCVIKRTSGKSLKFFKFNMRLL